MRSPVRLGHAASCALSLVSIPVFGPVFGWIGDRSGPTLVGLGIVAALGAAAQMALARTSVIPRRNPSSMVTSGLFRWSRNPIYLADVLMQNTDSSAVLQTAEKMGKRAFGWDSDMTAYGPKAHLGSAIINWAPYYIKATKEALDGSWKGGTGVWWGHKEGAIDMVSIADDVPAETKARIDEIKAGLKAGTYNIWKGPIMGQDGKQILAKDAVADDKFLSGVNFYVKGVEGKVPGGK